MKVSELKSRDGVASSLLSTVSHLRAVKSTANAAGAASCSMKSESEATRRHFDVVVEKIVSERTWRSTDSWRPRSSSSG